MDLEGSRVETDWRHRNESGKFLLRALRYDMKLGDGGCKEPSDGWMDGLPLATLELGFV